MKTIITFLLFIALFFSACNNNQSSGSGDTDPTVTSSPVDPVKEWKFGVALWTFHDVNFPEALNFSI